MDSRVLTEGTWLNPPAAIEARDGRLLVIAHPESDFWRTTSYGFIHESGHGLLNDFADDSAFEVAWILDYREQFDQAGLLIWSDAEHWIKAGVEFADGAPQLGAVVTSGTSDWSVAPVPDWDGEEIEVRASRSGDAVTIRARVRGGEWQLVRLAPLDPAREWKVGLHCASPMRAGLTVSFTRAATGPADASLH